MASQNVSHLLGTLQKDPDNEEALQALAALVDDGAPSTLDDDAVRLLERARQGHDARAEYRAVAQLLELLARFSDHDPDRAASLLKELGRVYREELLDDERAKLAYERALALRPGDDDIQDALQQIEQTAEKWNDIATRFIEEAQSASDPTLKSSLLVSAASLVWKYRKRGRDKQVDSLFKEALEATEGADLRAARLYEQVLRSRQKWSELAQVLLDAAEHARTKEEKVPLYLRAARVMKSALGDSERAAACYERILDFVPGHSEAMAYLVERFMEREQWDHLVALYEDALRARTRLEDEAGALLQIGMVHWRFRGKLDDAEPHFARLRKVDPAHPGMLDFYREYLTGGDAARRDEQRWVTILTDAQRVATSEEQKLQLAIELAKAAQESSVERAIDAWKAVLRLDPTHPEAPEALKALYEKTEKWNALVELLKSEADHVPEGQPARKVALLRHLIPIYRDKLGLDVMVINTYNAILQLDPGDAEALDALASTYETTGRWNDLIGVLTRKAEATSDASEKVALYARVADLWIERFANYNQATEPLERVIQLEPDNRPALAQLKEIYRKKRAWGHLFDVLMKEAQLASDPSARLEHRLELAKLAGERLHRHADAIALWKEVLEQDGDNAEAVDALEKLAEREKDWPTLADVLERRVLETDDPKNKAKILQKLGVIYGEHMGQAVKAASAWKRILDVDPKNGRALRTLRETFLASQDWGGPRGPLRRGRRLGGPRRRARQRRRARAGGPRQGGPQLPRRRDLRAEAAAAAPRVPELRARARGRPEQRAGGARAHPALRARREVEPTARAPRGAARARRQRRGSGSASSPTLRALAVDRLSDAAAAFGYAGRAFELAPTEEAVRTALEQEAERATKHGAALELYLARLENLESQETAPEEQLWLRRRVASIASERLGQTELAVEQLRAILEVAPDDPDAPDALEAIYRGNHQSRELRGLLLHRVEHARDDAERLRHLAALARLEEEVLEDPDSASARYRRVLEIEGADRAALAALDRLSVAAGRWEEVADVIGRRRELAQNDAERNELTLRLGEARATALSDFRGALEAFAQVVRARPDSGRAIAGLELVAASDESLAEEVSHLLEAAYEATGAWEKLAAIIEKRLATTGDAAEKRALRLRYAELSSRKIQDTGSAYQALEDAFLDDPGDEEMQDRLMDAAEQAGRHEDLATAFSTALEAGALGPAEAAALASKVAQLYDVVLARPEDAEPFHLRVLAHDPLEEQSFGSLKELYTNAERWAELQKLYRDRIAETVDAEAKLDLLLQVCFLFEELIDDPEQAIKAYRDVLELDPEHQASRRALERLYERTERWRDLVTLLRAELDRANPDERVGLTQRLGVLHEKKLAEPAQAVDHYEQVLVVEPNHKHAREALERLLVNPGQRQRIARILEPIYEERGDWAELCSVLEVQLEEVAEPGSLVALLTRVAELQENRLHDPAAAFGSVARAVGADPTDAAVREELARLARMRGSERERAAVLENAVQASAERPSLAGELLLELAQLWDERVGDVDEAESAYARLIEVDPDNADAVLAASRALERIHLGKGDHAALAEDLRRQVRLESSDDDRKRLLVRLADLLEEVLNDPAGAVAAHQERLELDPGDVDAMRSLERLYEQQGEWQKLIGILQARDGVVADEEEQRAIAHRIGAIYEEQLEDADNAIIAYNDALSRFGRDAETLGALTRLYEQAGKWQDLLEVAEMVYEMAEQGAVRAAIRFQMGEIMRAHTGELERAVEAYAEVLDLAPDHEGALASLSTVMGAEQARRALFGETTTQKEAALPPEGEADAAAPGAFGDEAPTEEMAPEAAAAPRAIEHPLPVRIEAARVLVPRFEAIADYNSLLGALLVLAESDDPAERFRALRRAAEVAEVGIEDTSLAFSLQSRAVRAGLAEDDLGLMLRDLGRLAEASERWSDYSALLQEVAPEILDGELVIYALTQVAEAARERLAQPELARRYYERVLEQQPDHEGALDALEELTTAAHDHVALPRRAAAQDGARREPRRAGSAAAAAREDRRAGSRGPAGGHRLLRAGAHRGPASRGLRRPRAPLRARRALGRSGVALRAHAGGRGGRAGGDPPPPRRRPARAPERRLVGHRAVPAGAGARQPARGHRRGARAPHGERGAPRHRRRDPRAGLPPADAVAQGHRLPRGSDRRRERRRRAQGAPHEARTDPRGLPRGPRGRDGVLRAPVPRGRARRGHVGDALAPRARAGALRPPRHHLPGGARGRRRRRREHREARVHGGPAARDPHGRPRGGLRPLPARPPLRPDRPRRLRRARARVPEPQRVGPAARALSRAGAGGRDGRRPRGAPAQERPAPRGAARAAGPRHRGLPRHHPGHAGRRQRARRARRAPRRSGALGRDGRPPAPPGGARRRSARGERPQAAPRQGARGEARGSARRHRRLRGRHPGGSAPRGHGGRARGARAEARAPAAHHPDPRADLPRHRSVAEADRHLRSAGRARRRSLRSGPPALAGRGAARVPLERPAARLPRVGARARGRARQRRGPRRGGPDRGAARDLGRARARLRGGARQDRGRDGAGLAARDDGAGPRREAWRSAGRHRDLRAAPRGRARRAEPPRLARGAAHDGRRLARPGGRAAAQGAARLRPGRARRAPAPRRLGARGAPRRPQRRHRRVPLGARRGRDGRDRARVPRPPVRGRAGPRAARRRAAAQDRDRAGSRRARGDRPQARRGARAAPAPARGRHRGLPARPRRRGRAARGGGGARAPLRAAGHVAGAARQPAPAGGHRRRALLAGHAPLPRRRGAPSA
ncbi:MAG: tetratricopeptide repeat protein [Sandaracinaceae bacterium]|nr:tetratricopeptide repeat protein [Sandaracinaceae bacterium]